MAAPLTLTEAQAELIRYAPIFRPSRAPARSLAVSNECHTAPCLRKIYPRSSDVPSVASWRSMLSASRAASRPFARAARPRCPIRAPFASIPPYRPTIASRTRRCVRPLRFFCAPKKRSESRIGQKMPLPPPQSIPVRSRQRPRPCHCRTFRRQHQRSQSPPRVSNTHQQSQLPRLPHFPPRARKLQKQSPARRVLSRQKRRQVTRYAIPRSTCLPQPVY